MSSGGAISNIVAEKLIEITINIIQMKLLKNASSRVFTQTQAGNNLTQLGDAIIRKNGKCGHPIPAAEDEEGLRPPFFRGEDNFIVARRRRRRIR